MRLRVCVCTCVCVCVCVLYYRIQFIFHVHSHIPPANQLFSTTTTTTTSNDKSFTLAREVMINDDDNEGGEEREEGREVEEEEEGAAARLLREKREAVAAKKLLEEERGRRLAQEEKELGERRRRGTKEVLEQLIAEKEKSMLVHTRTEQVKQLREAYVDAYKQLHVARRAAKAHAESCKRVMSAMADAEKAKEHYEASEEVHWRALTQTKTTIEAQIETVEIFTLHSQVCIPKHRCMGRILTNTHIFFPASIRFLHVMHTQLDNDIGSIGNLDSLRAQIAGEESRCHQASIDRDRLRVRATAMANDNEGRFGYVNS